MVWNVESEPWGKGEEHFRQEKNVEWSWNGKNMAGGQKEILTSSARPGD